MFIPGTGISLDPKHAGHVWDFVLLFIEKWPVALLFDVVIAAAWAWFRTSSTLGFIVNLMLVPLLAVGSFLAYLVIGSFIYGGSGAADWDPYIKDKKGVLTAFKVCARLAGSPRVPAVGSVSCS